MSPYQLVEGRHGRFLVNPNDFYIGRALIEYGEYAEAEWRTLNQLIMLGGDVVEVGANIGSLTVPIAKKLQELGRRLLAIEPQPVIFQNLCANLALNGLFNVLSECMAVSHTPGRLYFESPDYQRAHSNFGAVQMRDTLAAKVEGARSHQAVRSDQLDMLVPDDFSVSLIKIDVEGFELPVLESAMATIARHRPVLYLENDQREKSQALIEWLWTVGYDLWWSVPPLFNPDNYRGNQKNLYPNVVSVNMLAIPVDSSISIIGFPKIVRADERPF